jgi:hypothetical protein
MRWIQGFISPRILLFTEARGRGKYIILGWLINHVIHRIESHGTTNPCINRNESQ